MAGHSKETRARAEALWRNGMSVRKVAVEVGVGHSTIARWAIEWKKSDSGKVVSIASRKKPPQKSNGTRPAKRPARAKPRKKRASKRDTLKKKPVPSHGTPKQRDTPSVPRQAVVAIGPPALHGVQGRFQLTVEKAEEIAALIEDTGAYVAVAARAAGVSVDRVKYWTKRGRQVQKATEDPARKLSPREALYLHFVTRIDEAEAQAEIHHTRNMRHISTEELADAGTRLRASVQYLARKHPERWSEKGRVTVEGGDKPIKHAHAHAHIVAEMNPDDMLAALDMAVIDAPKEAVEED